MCVECWYGHLETEEIVPLLEDAERRVEQAQGLLDTALVARDGLAAIIKSRQKGV